MSLVAVQVIISFTLVTLMPATEAQKKIYFDIDRSIEEILNANEKYSDDVECMAGYLIDNRVVQERLYTAHDRSKLKRDLEPYLPEAKASCEKGWVRKTFDFLTSCFTPSATDD